MRSVLEEFACGNISPEPCYFRHDSEYGQAMKKLAGCGEKLSSKEVFEGKENLTIGREGY